MFDYKIGDEFYYDGMIGKITNIFYDCYCYEHIGGSCCQYSLTKLFLKNSFVHNQSIPLTPIARLLYV